MSETFQHLIWAAAIVACIGFCSQCQIRREQNTAELSKAKLEACVKLNTCQTIKLDVSSY